MKNILIRRIHLLCTTVFVFLLHLPFSVAKPKVSTKSLAVRRIDGSSKAAGASIESKLRVYDSLRLGVCGLSREAYTNAIAGLEKLKQAGKIVNDRVISIADFTKSSVTKRLFIIDLVENKVLFNTWVAHGQNSGNEFASKFSNKPESLQSSLGFYQTSDTYIGKHGYSMHLNGLEKGLNDKAGERAIVLHGASYVSEGFIRSKGCLGRSWGCPAVAEKLTRPIIETIKNGTCLFIYGNNAQYLKQSTLING